MMKAGAGNAMAGSKSGLWFRLARKWGEGEESWIYGVGEGEDSSDAKNGAMQSESRDGISQNRTWKALSVCRGLFSCFIASFLIYKSVTIVFRPFASVAPAVYIVVPVAPSFCRGFISRRRWTGALITHASLEPYMDFWWLMDVQHAVLGPYE
jgi:hypothetical protein